MLSSHNFHGLTDSDRFTDAAEEAVAAKFTGIVRKAIEGEIRELFDAELYVAMDRMADDLTGYVQHRVGEMVQEIIAALVQGSPDRLPERWREIVTRKNADDVRAALCTAMPREIMDGRIADLEAEVERLRETLDRRRS